jgi:hypothetical protein
MYMYAQESEIIYIGSPGNDSLVEI